ncbi:MAG: D-alanyl-D-alanine carboxypeptidase [Oscillospiraceae bacterium]|jgi:D-alanyl-D-alanine carboxypeptidase|nr:D-alanyl-D-alanine carboxypeptidase [Oscillospiraceae bacterium]
MTRTKTSLTTKAVSAVLTLALLFSFAQFSAGAARQPSESASSAVLFDADTGELLYSDSPDVPRSIASITKIMTALVVLENLKLTDSVIYKQEWCDTEGSSSFFKAGETYTVRQMLYALILHSGNDTAVALANTAAGGTDKFAELMNKRAAEIGMTNSYFANPHGLEQEGHQSTARDMALLTAEALKNPRFMLIASTRVAKVGGISFKNHNRLLWDYPQAIGIKTGYTKAAGRTLVSAAAKNGRTLICVTLNDPCDWLDHTELYNWGFSR